MTELAQLLGQEPASIGNGEVVSGAEKVHFVRCMLGYCKEVLPVPENLYQQIQQIIDTRRSRQPVPQGVLGKQYDGFYVSNDCGFYCSEEHLRDFTED